jgi:hypothetical protein
VAGEWHTIEIASHGNEISTTVDGKKGARYIDPNNKYPTGTIALACPTGSTLKLSELSIQEDDEAHN